MTTESIHRLTPKQKKLLEFIQKFQKRKGYAPSQREIADHFGFKSLGTVQNYLVRLEKQGALSKPWNAKRAIQVIDQPNGPEVAPSSGQPTGAETVSLPLLGRVAAGLPIEAVQNQESLDVPQSMISRGEHFVLQVKGSSMIEDGILEGDFVVIRKQAQAENGQTVVALLNNEATIKRLKKKRQGVELHPANPAFEPIIVDSPGEGNDFKIEGVLVGLIRKL